MNDRTILLATDYSQSAQRALWYATSLARDTGAKLLIAHVSEVADYPVGELFDEDSKAPPAELKKLQAVVPSDPSVPHETKLLYGDPSDAIVELARQRQVEMIVMGTHGYSRLTHLLAGSVAESVIRKATCPVLVVKLPTKTSVTV